MPQLRNPLKREICIQAKSINITPLKKNHMMSWIIITHIRPWSQRPRCLFLVKVITMYTHLLMIIFQSANLLGYVFKASLADKWECQQENISSSVAQWSETIVIFLTYQWAENNNQLEFNPTTVYRVCGSGILDILEFFRWVYLIVMFLQLRIF